MNINNSSESGNETFVAKLIKCSYQYLGSAVEGLIIKSNSAYFI